MPTSTSTLRTYLTKRLARNFAKAEDAALLNGNWNSTPWDLLDYHNLGPELSVVKDNIKYKNIVRLFFTLEPEYRRNATWLMNDKTAPALRFLTDKAGNPLWNQLNNTILGKSVVIANDMPSVGYDNTPILFGDFSYYWTVNVRTLKEKFVTDRRLGGFRVCRVCFQTIQRNYYTDLYGVYST